MGADHGSQDPLSLFFILTVKNVSFIMTTYQRYIKAVMRTRRHVNRLCREEYNR